MQRWFFLEDSENAILREGVGDSEAKETPVICKPTLVEWEFRVWIADILPGETVCVTGNCDLLGNWVPEKCKVLEHEGNNIWSARLKIDKNDDVFYRYCVCVIVEPDVQVLMRRWETHLHPRQIKFTCTEPPSSTIDTFGENDNYYRVERGWLTKETVVQFKLFNNPVTLWKPRFANRTIFIKVTPVNLNGYNGKKPSNFPDALEESLSTDTQDVMEPPKHAYTFVANLTSNNNTFQPQEQFGKAYNPNDILLFETRVLDLTNIAFLIDLYIYSSRAVEEDPPYHVGFSYLLPSALQSTNGCAILPITSVKHRPMGQIILGYIVIKPMAGLNCDMSVSYAKHWKNCWLGLDIGHRGLGNSFKTQNFSEIRENTIASIKTACSYGADMVEFDVQLSKDHVPVIYHDFHVCIAMKRKKELDFSDMLELPLKELTLEQLHYLKVYHVTEAQTKNPKFFDEDLEEHQPFPTLKQVLEVIQPDVGFNVEIKWGTELDDGTFELDYSIDVNLYMDTILDVILKYAGNRRIIFSCFNADICTILRMKQNKYPVMFLTQGVTIKYQNYRDPRCLTIQAGVQFAQCMELLGLCVHTEDLLRDSSQVKLVTDNGLVLFCWGEDNNNPETIRYLKQLGLHAVIYDKIDQYSNKQVKESIFMVDKRESQRELMVVAEKTAETGIKTPPPSVTSEIVDIDKVQQSLMVVSTATSLSSLEPESENTPMIVSQNIY